ncbi:unnamed protein product [Clonostachys byssicola]|uniref:Major facilitator superfamily (MFS) profile domain-containing protein n=1 Tax=Clonostachys byssicola TaxID=160290 RepID=A0A9N9U4L8_9HYPO|nr:unnamed protein product [Clonostachys byssicola]
MASSVDSALIQIVGVFISQADATLVLATYGTIASEFNDLQNGSWLISSYMLAMCTAQPLYGKLSDIFGRKNMLQVSYGLFALGSLLCGFGQSILQLVVARSVQGLGGAGMVCLVSIIITDLVPLREVATYRSYVNIIQTMGRSSGGAIGGFLAQAIGWRWALSVQSPLTLIAMGLMTVGLTIDKQKSSHEEGDAPHPSLTQSLRRVDFAGALFMSVSVLSLLLILDVGGEKVPWNSPLILILLETSVAAGVLFFQTEKRWAAEPIFPLHLLSNRNVLIPYFISILQNATQCVLVFVIPLYFQVTQNSSTGEAGAYLIPTVAGNAIGGLLTGRAIKNTGRYKLATLLAPVSSCFCFVLLLLFWNGKTPIWQSLLVFFGGFGTGIAHSAIFVAIAAGVDEEHMAIASSGLYLSTSVGAVTGISAGSAVMQAVLRPTLEKSLVGVVPNIEEVVGKALSDIKYVQKLEGLAHELIVDAYLQSFRGMFILCIVLSFLCFVAGFLLREKRLS